MKSLKSIGIFVLSIFVFTIISCDNEPLEGEFATDDGGGTDLTCVEATTNLSTASTNFAGVTPGDANYTAMCNAYAIALQDQISACGDETGTIQILLDSLDCTSDTEGVFTVEFDGLTFEAEFIEAHRFDNQITITGTRDGDTETVTLVVHETTTGTYDLGVNVGPLTNTATYIEDINDAANTTWTTFSEDFVTPQGTITISSINETDLTMSGTFNFTGSNVSTPPDILLKEFTNGVFTDIPFTD